MALSHWKNTKEQEKFTTIKGFIFNWNAFWLCSTAFKNICQRCYLAEIQLQFILSQNANTQKIRFYLSQHADLGT